MLPREREQDCDFYRREVFLCLCRVRYDRGSRCVQNTGGLLSRCGRRTRGAVVISTAVSSLASA